MRQLYPEPTDQRKKTRRTALWSGGFASLAILVLGLWSGGPTAHGQANASNQTSTLAVTATVTSTVTPLLLSPLRPLPLDELLSGAPAYNPINTREVAKAVVRLTGCQSADDCSGSSGTGVIIHASGVILTAWHVTAVDQENLASPLYPLLKVEMTEAFGQSVVLRYRARVIASDPDQDLALLRIYWDESTGRPVVVDSLNHLPHLALNPTAPEALLDTPLYTLGYASGERTVSFPNDQMSRLDAANNLFELQRTYSPGFSGGPVLVQEGTFTVAGVVIRRRGELAERTLIRTLDQIDTVPWRWTIDASRAWGEQVEATLVNSDAAPQLQLRLEANLLGFVGRRGQLIIYAIDATTGQAWVPASPAQLTVNFSAQHFVDRQPLTATIHLTDAAAAASLLFKPLLWDVEAERLLWQSDRWYGVGASTTDTLAPPTPTFTPSATPDLVATETALAQAIDAAVVATLTALPTATPTPRPTATPTPTASPTPAEPAAGATRVNPKDSAVYVYVPAGEFLMGSADSDPDASDDEKPQHKVYLDAFWIMRTEVTNAQYTVCVKAGACTEPNNTRWDDPAYADHPVTHVNWEQANVYAQWAGGWLPTEAQWEKAARGVDGRIYPWGDEPPTDQLVNFNREVNDTKPVGSYPNGASPYGAWDMAGNVWEWTADWYDAKYYATLPTFNPKGPEKGDYRTLRGGAFGHDEYGVRCALRNWGSPAYGDGTVGFRVVSPDF